MKNFKQSLCQEYPNLSNVKKSMKSAMLVFSQMLPRLMDHLSLDFERQRPIKAISARNKKHFKVRKTYLPVLKCQLSKLQLLSIFIYRPRRINTDTVKFQQQSLTDLQSIARNFHADILLITKRRNITECKQIDQSQLKKLT